MLRKADQHPSVIRIAGIANALGNLSSDVVFIGGAVAPLLQTHPVLPRVRPTADIDAIVASTDYAEFTALEERIRVLGFKTQVGQQKHIHRWQAPDGTIFDLAPVGAHLGGTGGTWDQIAIDTAVAREISAGITVKHASAVGFLCLKWAAFWNRGVRDPFRSEDLEDILALLVSRADIATEISSAPLAARDYIQRGLHWLKEYEEYDDIVAAFLSHATEYSLVLDALNAGLESVLAE